jgi:hypothetical protein
MNAKPTRRSFFGHAGAVLAAPLSATAAFAGEHAGPGDVAGRLAALEDLNAIRALLRRYVRLVGTGRREELGALFADPERASIDEHVRSAVADTDDTIAIAANGTATARVACTVETATPIERCGTLVEMARLQGDGFVRRSETRVLESSFVKRNGIWKIEHAEFLA